MQIVIEIPEEYYNGIKSIPDRQCDADMLIIKRGTPLPKGHGDLIDRGELRCGNVNFDTYNDYRTMFDEIDNAPTIIEADKESVDANSN